MFPDNKMTLNRNSFKLQFYFRNLEFKNATTFVVFLSSSKHTEGQTSLVFWRFLNSAETAARYSNTGNRSLIVLHLCCLQIDVSYNLPDPVSKPAFHLKVDLKEPYQERHPQPPSSTSSSSSSSSPRHLSSRPRSRADNRSELNRKRRAPIDDDDPAAHQDKMDFQISLEVCARSGRNYQ